jgi:hypothetical protein
MKKAMLAILAALVQAPTANAAPPDVENRFVQLVQQHTGTTSDRQTILSATYDDVCGPVRPMDGVRPWQPPWHRSDDAGRRSPRHSDKRGSVPLNRQLRQRIPFALWCVQPNAL